MIALTFIFLLIAFYYDFKYQVIPNLLTIGFASLGLFISYFEGRLAESISGALLGSAIFLFPFVLRWVGGGDVKFAFALGSFTDVHFIMASSFYGLILAGMLSLLVLYNRGKMKSIIAAVKFVTTKNKDDYVPTSLFLPLGSCISVVSMLLLILEANGMS